MFFFLQLFCVVIIWWICLFFASPKQKDWESLLQKSLRFHSTPYDDKCASTSPRGRRRRFFDPVDLRFPTQTFDTTRFNSELEGGAERPERPNQSWRTCGSSTMPNKGGGVMFFSQLPTKKIEKKCWEAWFTIIESLNLGGKDVDIVNQHIQFHLFEWYSWTVLLGIPKGLPDLMNIKLFMAYNVKWTKFWFPAPLSLELALVG